MSAASPKIQDKAGEKAHEPSMEEILASIRRIIADDQAVKPTEAAARGPAPEPDDILDLADMDEPMLDPAKPEAMKPEAVKVEPIRLESIKPEPAKPEPAARKPEPVPQPAPLDLDALDFDAIDFDAVDFDAAEPEPPRVLAPEPKPAPRAAAPEPRPARAQEPASPLVSTATGASVTQAFGLLADTVSSQHARSLEELVQDMLKPMLKTWLDDNLPVMVERLVRAEIERVSRGR